MQLQCCPVPQSRANQARPVLAQMCDKLGIRLQPLPSLEALADKVPRIETPYCYFEIPGDNTAKGRSIDRFVIVGGSVRIPMVFPRQVVCELLELRDRVDWRACAGSADEEALGARVLREQFAAFDPRKKST